MDQKTEILFMEKIRECDSIFRGKASPKKRDKLSENTAVMAHILSESGLPNRAALIAQISDPEDQKLANQTLKRLADLLHAGGLSHECINCGKCGKDGNGNPKNQSPQKSSGVPLIDEAIGDITMMFQKPKSVMQGMFAVDGAAAANEIDLASFTDDELSKI